MESLKKLIKLDCGCIYRDPYEPHIICQKHQDEAEESDRRQEESKQADYDEALYGGHENDNPFKGEL